MKKYFKIPIYGVIELFDFENNKNALFIGTKNTINYLKKQEKNIEYFDGTDLIKLIETKGDIELYLKEKEDIFLRYPTIMLGCTHLIAIKQYFKQYLAQDELYLQSKCSIALATPLCSLSSVI